LLHETNMILQLLELKQKFCEKTAKQFKVPRVFAPVLHTFSRKLSGKQTFSHKFAQNKYFCKHFRKNIANYQNIFTIIVSFFYIFAKILVEVFIIFASKFLQKCEDDFRENTNTELSF
jgi:hypothetical protein